MSRTDRFLVRAERVVLGAFMSLIAIALERRLRKAQRERPGSKGD